jgi:hypothetical protein
MSVRPKQPPPWTCTVCGRKLGPPATRPIYAVGGARFCGPCFDAQTGLAPEAGKK